MKKIFLLAQKIELFDLATKPKRTIKYAGSPRISKRLNHRDLQNKFGSLLVLCTGKKPSSTNKSKLISGFTLW